LDSDTFVCPLIQAGLQVERFFNHFRDPTTKDVVWIEACAANRWLILTADKDIATVPDEIAAVMTFGAALFILTCGRGTNHSILSENMARTARKILAFHSRNRPPFIAKVNRPNSRAWTAGRPGDVRMFRTYEDWAARTGSRGRKD
jgi:PIN like domain